MADGLNINIGTEGSTLSDSKFTIGEVNSGKDLRIGDQIYAELQDVKTRLKAVETYLIGNLGEPGLTGQVARIKEDVKRIEREIEMVDVLDSRLDKLDEILRHYDPMWSAMERSYTSKVTLPVYVFYAITVVLIASVILVIIAVFYSRGF